MDFSSIPDLLICKFCSKPFVEPVKTKDEDARYFCRICISHFLLKRQTSETTRANLLPEDQPSKLQSLIPVTEPLVLLMLDSLLVRCTKCGEINIKRGQLGEHENQSCTQASVLCGASVYKCPWQGPREEFSEHREKCKFEKIRPALEHIFYEQDEIRDRLGNLENEINDLISVKMSNGFDVKL